MNYLVEDAVVDGRDGPIAVRDYVPTTSTGRNAFLWVHGGGFTSGGLDQRESDGPARALAQQGRRVRTIDYRLAPKVPLRGKLVLTVHPNRFPAAHHDVIDVATALAAESGEPIGIGGASAGASLAAAAAIDVRETGGTSLTALVLAYGTFHAELPDRPDVEVALRGPLAKWAFNPEMTRRMNLNYVGQDALLRPGTAFPGGSDLHGLAPTLVLNADNDRLRRSGDTFADELRGAGVEVRHEVIKALHGYLGARRSAGYKASIPLIVDWLDRHDEPAPHLTSGTA